MRTAGWVVRAAMVAAAVVCTVAATGPVAAAPASQTGPQMCVAPNVPESRADAKPTLRVPVLVGGQRAYVDPDTGRLIVPSRQQAQLMEISLDELAAMSRSSLGLETFALPDGGVGARLAGRFQVGTFATLGDDGRLHLTHYFHVAAPVVDPRQEDRR